MSASDEDPTTPLNSAPAKTTTNDYDDGAKPASGATSVSPLHYGGTGGNTTATTTVTNNKNNAPDVVVGGYVPYDLVVVSAPYALYRGVPCGMDTYTWDSRRRQLHWMSRRCCCCGCMSETPQGDLVQLPGGVDNSYAKLDLVIAREPISCLRMIRDGFLSFLFAMFFHFVPAVLSGVASALGSAENHQRWGMVWFGLWPIWWLIATCLLRPWGVRVVNPLDDDGCCGPKVVSFLPLTTHEMAVEMSEWLKGLLGLNDGVVDLSPVPNNAFENDIVDLPEPNCPPQPRPRSFLRPATVLGTSILIFLLAWGVHTMLLIEECNDMGCCKDDGKTLANCTRMWDERN